MITYAPFLLVSFVLFSELQNLEILTGVWILAMALALMIGKILVILIETGIYRFITKTERKICLKYSALTNLTSYLVLLIVFGLLWLLFL